MTLLSQLPYSRQHSLPVLLIFTLAILACLFSAQLLPLLEYQHYLITQGQFWRLFSGHFFHTNLNHLLLNLAGLCLLWALHGHYYQAKNYLGLVLFSCVFTSIGLYYYSPNIISYVGLSGILHGIFIWGACQDIRHKITSGYILLFGVIGKIAHEQYNGPSLEVEALINATVAIDAHMWGAISGLLFFLLGLICFKLKYQQNA